MKLNIEKRGYLFIIIIKKLGLPSIYKYILYIYYIIISVEYIYIVLWYDLIYSDIDIDYNSINKLVFLL